MAVMNGTGGIDQQITNRITSAGGDPQKLMGEYGNTKSILDLIAAQRAADLVKQQKQQLALEMNGNPATVADQLEKELVDGQKAEMRGPLEGLKSLRGGQTQGDRVQGVSGVLQNQQRQQQQRPTTRRVAMGGIINAPAPNLNRMYNGGIVGYAEGGLTGDEIAAYLKRAGIKQEDYDNATPRVRARVIEGINKLIASDKEELRRAPGDPLVADRRRQIGEFFTAPFRGPETGEELMKGREEFNPTERRDAAERLMNLPDARGGMELDIGTMEQPTPLKDDIYGRLPTMMPKGAMDNLEAYDKQYGAPTGTEEELKAASLLTASEPNNQPATVEKKPKPELTALEQLQQDTEKAFDPFANANANAGIASVVDSKRPTPAVNPPGYKKGELSPEGQRMLEMQEAIQAAGIKDTPEGLTGSAAIQKKLDDMGGKKGIAGLVERFANTNFKKSYGDNFGALAEAGRNIAETGQKEKAQRRKFLEDQLGVQQAIEAADVAAKRDREKFDITEGRLSQKMSIDDKNTVAEIALKANTDRNAALARLAKLNLDTVNAEGAQEYRMASLALQEQANTIREKGNTTAVQKVVQGYVNSATNFYKGLLANAMTPETEAAVKQELQDEISRIVGIVGPDNVLDLKKLQRTPAGATAPDSGFSDFEKEE